MGIMKDIYQSMQEVCTVCYAPGDHQACNDCQMSILSRDRNGKLIRVYIKDKQIDKVEEVISAKK